MTNWTAPLTNRLLLDGGVLLLFEALTLLSLARELASSSRDWTIALIVALAAFVLPQGYLIGVIAGLLLDRLLPRTPPATPTT